MMIRMSKLLMSLTNREIKLQKLMILFYLTQAKPFALMGLQDRITNQELVILLDSSFFFKVEDGVTDSIRKVPLKIVLVDLKCGSDHHLNNFILLQLLIQTIFFQSILTITSETGKKYI